MLPSVPTRHLLSPRDGVSAQLPFIWSSGYAGWLDTLIQFVLLNSYSFIYDQISGKVTINQSTGTEAGEANDVLLCVAGSGGE